MTATVQTRHTTVLATKLDTKAEEAAEALEAVNLINIANATETDGKNEAKCQAEYNEQRKNENYGIAIDIDPKGASFQMLTDSFNLFPGITAVHRLRKSDNL